jgi:tetratricopeptide (TPR) repeat protein
MIVVIIAVYLYDVIMSGTPYMNNLFKVAAILCAYILTIVRIATQSGRKALRFYEKFYAESLGNAFEDRPRLRKKLLCACRFYDESNYKSAFKCLDSLLEESESRKDSAVVLLFTALCYTETAMPEEAIKAYNQLLKLDPCNAQAHSNLGNAYMKSGEYEAALFHFDKSIEYKPDQYYAYINRANLFFRIRDLSSAVYDAKKALSIKNNGSEAANLLAIIYALVGDEENKRKFFHIAISLGTPPERLKNAINYYLSEADEDEEEYE